MIDEKDKEIATGTVVFKVRELQIATTVKGDEVVQIKPSIAFDADFIDEMKHLGVKAYIKRDENGDEMENEG